MTIQVRVISQKNINCEENGGKKKAHLANPKHRYRVSQWENMIVVPITKRMEIIMSI